MTAPPWRRALGEAGLFFVAALFLFRSQIGRWDGFLDFDGHFHLRVAQWIAHFGLWTDLPWLPYTVLGALARPPVAVASVAGALHVDRRSRRGLRLGCRQSRDGRLFELVPSE